MSDTPRTDAYEIVNGVRYVMQPRAGFPDMPAFARQLERELAIKQAKIDRLMLEFCPDEMTPAQRENWEAHQKAVDIRHEQDAT